MATSNENLQQIDIKINGDTSNFNESMKQVNKTASDLTKNLSKIDEQVQKLTNHFNTLLKNIGRANSLNSKYELSNVIRSGDVRKTSEINGVKRSYTTSRNSMIGLQEISKMNDLEISEISKNGKTIRRLQNAQARLANAMEKEALAREKNVDKLANAKATKAEADLLKAQNTKERTEINKNWLKYRSEHPEKFVANKHRKSYGVGEVFNQVGSSISDIGIIGRIGGDVLSTVGTTLMNPVLGLGVALNKTITAVKDFSRATTEAFKEIEAVKANLSVVYGSSSQANIAFDQLADYAVKSPFGVAETSELAILLRQSGVYSTELLDTLKMIGDTAGGNMEKMKRIANNYAQIVAAGKANAMDMRQFANAGIPIYEAMSKELGVSQQTLRKMISDGKVTSELVEKVFKNMTGINGVFENATEIGAKTLKARIQNLEDIKQLALASLGENKSMWGAKYGNDSHQEKLLEFKEEFWQNIYDKTTLKNIDKNVQILTQNKTRIEELKDLIAYSSKISDKDTKRIFEEELKKLENLFDTDKEREIYLAQYQAAMKNYDTLFNKFLGKEFSYIDLYSKRQFLGYFTPGEDVESFINTLKTPINRESIIDYFSKQYPDYSMKKIQEMVVLYYDDLENTIKDLRDYNTAYRRKLELTYKNYLAYYETDVLGGQENAYTSINKASDKGDSVLSNLGVVIQEWEKLPAQQEKAQEEQKSKWAKTIDIISNIEKNTDDKGVVDISKFGLDKILEYRDKGVFRGEKLNVINNDKGTFEKEDRDKLTKQFTFMINTIQGELANKGDYNLLNGINNSFKDFDTNITDDKKFLANFDKTFSDIKSILNSILSSDNLSDKDKTFYNKLLQGLELSTLKLTSDKLPDGFNLEDLNKVKTTVEKIPDTFIPLWKRILSSATGVSANAVTGTEQTLNFYRDNLAIRNRTGNVLSNALKSGLSVDMVQRLTSNRVGKTQLQGDNSYTWQIDWKSVNENISKFAKQLSISTTVIDSYTSSLEEELNTYKNLLGSGILTSETDNVKQARYISAKQADKLLQSEGEQGVNAFGEELTTTTGEIVYSIKQGIAYDKEGNKLENQNLIINGKIYELLKKNIADTEKELQNAKNVQIGNDELEKMYNDVYSSYLVRSLQENSGLDFNEFIFKNPELLTKYFENTNLSDVFSRDKVNELNSKGILDTKTLFSKYLQGNEDEEIVKAITELLLIAINRAKDFMESSEYKGLKSLQDNKDKTELLNKDMSVLGNSSFGKPTLENPVSLETLKGLSLKELLPLLMNGSGLEYAGLSGKNSLTTLFEEQKGKENSFETFEEMVKTIESAGLVNIFKELNDELVNLSKTFLKTAWTTPFETIGESLVKICKGSKTWGETLKDVQTSMTQLAGSMLQQIGPAMAEAGFALVKLGASTGNFGMIAAGLGMAALGGFAKGFGSFLSSATQETEDDDEIDKLEDLKSQLADLLEQARSDALYYEKNLRHRKAIGTNASFSYQKVNDAIISPNGNVISTAPDDYLIATKTPQNFANHSQQMNVKINNIVNNNANVQVRQEEKRNNDGSIDIITIIEEGVSNFIASERSDEAFNIRSARLQGRSSVM